MAKELVSDALWERVRPHLPPHPPRPKGGRPPIDDRRCLTGILFVLKTGIPWEELPAELGCGSGMTCWRRLRDWQKAGVWQSLWSAMLDELGKAQRIDWSKAILDACTTRAIFGGSAPALTPPIAAKTAPNATWSPTGTAPRWPSRTRRPTCTIRRWRWL